MTAGDTHVIREKETRYIKTGRHIHSKASFSKAVQTKGELKNINLCPIQSMHIAT